MPRGEGGGPGQAILRSRGLWMVPWLLIGVDNSSYFFSPFVLFVPFVEFVKPYMNIQERSRIAF